MSDRKPKSGRSKTSPETCRRTAQEIESLELRMEDKQLWEIAKLHGVTPSCVSRRLQKCLKEAVARRAELADELLDLQLIRYDAILQAMLPKIESEASVPHAEVALKTLTRRDKLLGLEAPVKHQLPEDFGDRLFAAMRAASGLIPPEDDSVSA